MDSLSSAQTTISIAAQAGASRHAQCGLVCYDTQRWKLLRREIWLYLPIHNNIPNTVQVTHKLISRSLDSSSHYKLCSQLCACFRLHVISSCYFCVWSTLTPCLSQYFYFIVPFTLWHYLFAFAGTPRVPVIIPFS